jgi:hypothetical protein
VYLTCVESELARDFPVYSSSGLITGMNPLSKYNEESRKRTKQVPCFQPSQLRQKTLVFAAPNLQPGFAFQLKLALLRPLALSLCMRFDTTMVKV